MTGSGAVSLAERTFAIQRPAWKGPTLGDAGAHVERYLNETEAAEVLPDGKDVLAQLTVPLRSAVGSGQLEPLSLSLQSEGDVYRPANPLVPVSISRQAAGGVTLPLGINITPVQAAEPEPASTVGDRVVFPGTAHDTDYMVETLAAGGVEASWQLLSEESPQENSLRFNLPAGASLQMSATVPGQAEVVSEGNVILTIPPADAVEANGVMLPVSYSVSGNVLSTHVDLGGSVAYPVMVDPTVFGGYGQYGAGHWNGWKYYSNCGCINEEEQEGLILAWTEPGPANGDYGEWYVDAPGAGKAGGAKITRVWIDEMTHQPAYQSTVDAEIGGEDEDTGPVWTNNGTDEHDTKPAPMVRDGGFTEDLEFCAQGEGGTGEELCNQNYGANYFDFLEDMGPEARTVDNYTMIYGAIIWYLDKTAPSEVTLDDLPSGWVKYGPSPTWIHAKDEGTGIAAFKVEIPPGHLNEKGEPFFAQESSCTTEAGFVGCPEEEYSNAVNFSELATGSYPLGVYAYDATGNVREESPDPHLYIDHTPPTIESLTGSLVENASKIGAGDYTLNFNAVDGSTTAPQSGVHTITVAVDGTKVDEVTTSCPSPSAVPTANCFGLSGSWTMEGERYGAGPHTITVTAKDWVGNESTETLHITSDEATYTSLGPGSVNLQTGDFKLGGADVNVGGASAALTLSRSYESRNSVAGASGPLGPQWSLGLPDGAAGGIWQSLTVEPSGNVAATLVNGERLAFVHSGSSFTSPAGYQTETLSGSPTEKPTEYRLTNSVGGQTIFKHAEHEEEGRYSPVGIVQAAGAGGLNKVTDLFEKTSEGVTRPKEVLAPSPAGANCEAELVKGCRALTFNYAESTTATGEGPEEWGDYKGRLTRVYLHAWNPKAGEKGEMTTTTIAQYAYDTKGRLRAEWNPQISPALKTTYGYDPEGHVTAVTAPGQETWALTYGTTATDSNAGRLMKALQAPTSAGVWKGEAVASSEAPSLSGSPVVGVRMAVSLGKWSGSPVAYGYKWEDCNSAGGECSVIEGADNPNYTPTGSDVGHSLIAQVTATNGGGSTVATTSASAEVVQPGEAFSAYKLSSPFECPHDATIGSDGNTWFTDACDHQVGKITPTGETTAYSFPSGVCLGGIAAGSDKNLWAAEECTNRLAKITTKGEITEYSLPSGSHPVQIAAGASGYIWFTEYGTSKIGKFNTTTDKVEAEYSLPPYSDPYGIALGSDGNMWFTEWGPGKIGKITTSGEITEYGIGATKYPLNITGGPDKNLWFTEEGSEIGKITTGGSITEYSLPSGSEPTGIAAGPEGNLRFTEAKSSKIGEITTGGAISEYTLPSGSYPMSIVTANDGNHMWFTDEGNNQIGEISTQVLGAYKLSTPFECPHYAAQGPDGNMWFTDNCDHQVGKITPGGIATAYSFPSGVELAGITSGPDGNVWAAEEGTNKVAKITTSGSITEYALASGSEPRGIATGSDKNLWVTLYGTSKIAKVTTSGTATEYGLPSGSDPSGIAAGPEEALWASLYGTSKVAKVTTAGSITEHSLPSGSDPSGLVEGSDGNLWIALEGTSKIAKMTPSGTVSEYSLPSGSRPTGIASGPEGNLWVTLNGTNKVARITTGGTITEYALPSGSSPVGIATGPGSQLWFADNSSNCIGTITPPASTSEAEAISAQPGWTIEYNVPVTGGSAPHEMSTSEVAKWAQKDDPVSATAILPVSETKSQGWPASSYPQATIYYFDSQERTVNVANPAGGITTTEYNSSNDNVERALTADDRAVALKEGSKSAEVAEHLSTESKYNSEGTELTSTLGPERKVKLAGTTEEVSARKRTAYSYNEGAPAEGGPYYLVTKTVETAKLANGEEKNERAIDTSYSGQEGLGWKLHEPTSTTTAPGGLNLTHTTRYSTTTGAEIETLAPSSPQISEYALPSGSEPYGIAVGSDKNLWFTDYGTGKVGKITTAGAISEYAAEKDEPEGITSGSDNNLWFVEHSVRHVNHITTGGELTVYTLGRTGTYNVGIASGPDSNLWFTESSDNYIGKINTKDEVQGEYALPSGSEPYGITVGPEKDLWFADHGTSKIGKSTTAGTITEYTLPSGSKPYGAVEGPDGNLWFTEAGTSKIAKITSTGSLTEYALPSGSEPYGITVGPEKDLWFTEHGTNKIGRSTTSGEVTEYALPSGSKPQGITSGPDNNLWFTEAGTSKIAKINPAALTGSQEARNSQTIYYSAGTEAGIPACENHPEWANLPCQTQPAHQPETAGLPELPVTTYTYNLYDEPEVTKSTSGTSTRTETDTYDAAGRLASKELIATVGSSLPKITYQYNKETGAFETQSAGEHTISSIYNTHGQLTS